MITPTASDGGRRKEVVKVLRGTLEEVKEWNKEKGRMLGRRKVVVVAGC